MNLPTDSTEAPGIATKSPPCDDDNELPSFQDIGATFFSSMVNVTNSIIGAGILSIPYTIHNTGLIGSLLLLLIAFVLSMFGSRFLVVASYYTKKDSFGGIGGCLYNKSVAILSDVTLIIYNLGISTAYFVILFEQVLDLLETWGRIDSGYLWNNRWWITYIVTFVLSVPLLSIRNLDNLKYTSLGAVACIALFVVISIYLGIFQLVNEPLHYNLFPINVDSVTASIAVFSSALCFHINIPRMVNELKYPKSSKFSTKVHKMFRIGLIATGSSTVLYYLVGSFAYFAFGDSIAGNLLTNFQAKGYWYLEVVKLAYAFVVLFSNPVIANPSIRTIDRTFFKTPQTWFRSFIESFVWCTIVWAIAVAVPQLELVFGVSGASAGSLLIYVLPSFYYIAVVKRMRKRSNQSAHSILGPEWHYIFAHILIVVMLIVGTIATVTQIMSIR